MDDDLLLNLHCLVKKIPVHYRKSSADHIVRPQYHTDDFQIVKAAWNDKDDHMEIETEGVEDELYESSVEKPPEFVVVR
jgi:hypothetical protein